MVRPTTIEDMAPTMRGKALGDVAPDEAVARDDLVFNALLYPNRSLPNNGFYAVMAVVIAVNLCGAVVYFLLGAWPIIFFAGGDILAVWLAFKISYRQGRQHERIFLSEQALWVCRVLPSGHETRWRLHPYWTQLHIDRPVQHESQLRLRSHGRTLIVGSFLSPDERGDLAAALQTALDRACQRAVTPSQSGG